MHDFKGCLELIKEVLEESGGQNEYAIHVKGLILRQEGDVQESLNMFQMAAALNAGDAENIKQVAKSLHLLGKHAAAVEVYQEAMAVTGRDWDVLNNIGLCYMNMRDYDTAESFFRQSLAETPQDVVYLNLGKVLTLQQKFKDAEEVYEQAIQNSPQSAELLTTLGLLYLRTEKNDRALQLLAKSLQLDGKNSRTVIAAASIMQDHSDHDNALSEYRQVVAQSPNSPQVWNNIGMCFFGKQRFIAAIACLKKALFLGPFEWIVSYNLGLVYLNTGQYASAFHYFSAAINLKPDFAHSYMYLGVALAKLEDIENACLAYERAMELEDDWLFHLNYAVTLHNAGQVPEAEKHYAQFEKAFEQLDEETKKADPDVLQAKSQLEALLKKK